MDGQAPAGVQSLHQRAPFGPSPDVALPGYPAVGFPGFPVCSSRPAPGGHGRGGGPVGGGPVRPGLGHGRACGARGGGGGLRAGAGGVGDRGPRDRLSLGDAADLDPDLLEAMLGPDGLGGQALGPQFGQDTPPTRYAPARSWPR